jgi:hypothetical protein
MRSDHVVLSLESGSATTMLGDVIPKALAFGRNGRTGS